MHPSRLRPPAAVLPPELRRFARQVQLGFTLTLMLSVAMLVLHG